MIGIAGILVIGVLAQWIAWRIKIASILLLLLTGLAAGAGTGFLNPDEIFGDLLFPLVSFSVAIILYEGGLSLRFRELRGLRKAVFNLVSVGALVTWVLTSLSAHYILGLNFTVAILLGAILIVSGPTVVLPMLRHVRPTQNVNSVLKWEGIFIDPIGAIVAVLTFDAIISGELNEAGELTSPTIGPEMFFNIGYTLLAGALIGAIAAAVLIVVLKNYMTPDFLQNSVSLAAVVGVFTLSNFVREESGLLAVIIMGLAVANQPYVSIHHIIAFKENLRVLLLSSLFIILAARLQREDITAILNIESLLFLVFLIVVVRPLATLVSTFRSRLSWQERAFIAWTSPRGIVAASITSIFGLGLAELGVSQANLLVPYAFLIIIGTVALYSLTASPVARWLNVAGPDPQGILILGANPLAQEIALDVQEQGFRVLLVDSNRRNVQGARLAGLLTHYGDILADHALDDIDLSGIGKFVALTPNDEVNSLAAVRLAEVFDRSDIFQLAPRNQGNSERRNGRPAQHLRGRIISGPNTTFETVSRRLNEGATVKKSVLTENYTYETFQEHYGGTAIPFFLIDEMRYVRVFTPEANWSPEPGDIVISIVDEVEPLPKGALQVSPGRVLTADEMEEAGLLSSYCDWTASVEEKSDGRGDQELQRTRD